MSEPITYEYAVTYDPPRSLGGGGRIHQPVRSKEYAEQLAALEAKCGHDPEILRRTVGPWEPVPTEETETP